MSLFRRKEESMGGDSDLERDKARAYVMAIELRHMAEALTEKAAALQEEIERGRSERDG